MNDKRKCAIYARVSKSEQELENQITQLKQYASILNSNVVSIYTDKMTGGAANRPQFQQMLHDARMRKFNVILVWSLDRFSREGIKNTTSYLEQLKQHNVALKSLQESWLDTSDEGVGELLIAIFSWVAKQEKQRISERTKAGLARSKKKAGRPKGSKDKKPRDTLGYKIRWSKKRVLKNP